MENFLGVTPLDLSYLRIAIYLKKIQKEVDQDRKVFLEARVEHLVRTGEWHEC